jgi:predicted nucleic acid-binding protein
MPHALYIDASAAMKLVVEEPESWALADALAGDQVISSEICRVELGRVLQRLGLGQGAERLVRGVVERIELLRLDDQILDRASEVGPNDLRTLDAIHLASALAIGRELDAVVTYDRRLAAAAEGAGFAVLSPI